MKGRRFLSVLLCLCLVVTMFPLATLPVAAGDRGSIEMDENNNIVITGRDGQTSQVDENWVHDYPYGIFALGNSELIVTEGGSEMVLTVYRLGGTAGKASAIIQYMPTVSENADGSYNYSSAISKDDILIEVENTLPIARYQPWGMPPEPEPTDQTVSVADFYNDEGEAMTRLSVPAGAGTYQWYALIDGAWEKIKDGTAATYELDAASFDLYDFRCVFTEDGARYCTDSCKGVAYVKPAEEVLPEPPADIHLNPEPGFTAMDLESGKSPYDGLLFELCFAQGEYEKEIRFTATDDSLAELDEHATLTLADCIGGEVLASMNTLLLRVADNDEEDIPSEIAFALTEASFDKSAGTAELTVVRSGGAMKPLSVDWSLTPGTAVAGVDYVDGEGTLYFYGEQTEATIEIELINDQIETQLEKYFTVELSGIKGDDISSITEASCTVGLYNTNTAELLNLASTLYDVEAVDVTGSVTESEGARVRTGEITGSQVTSSDSLSTLDGSAGGCVVDWNNRQSFDTLDPQVWKYNSGWPIEFSGGNWGVNAYRDFSVSGNGKDSGKNADLWTITKFNKLYTGYYGRFDGVFGLASWIYRIGDDFDGAASYFAFMRRNSQSVQSCNPYIEKSGVNVYPKCTRYNYFEVKNIGYSDTNYDLMQFMLYLAPVCSDDNPSENTISSNGYVHLPRRTIDGSFYLNLYTANDENITNAAAKYSSANYADLVKKISVGAEGGTSYGRLYEGSDLSIELNDTNLDCSMAYIHDENGAWHRDASSISGNTIIFNDLILEPSYNKRYTIKLVLERRQNLQINVTTSVDPDTGNKDDAYDLLRSRITGGISYGQANTQPSGHNYDAGNITTKTAAVGSLNFSSSTGVATSAGLKDVQWINFNLPAEDRLIINGRAYAGNEQIWLRTNNLTPNNIVAYYYHEDYLTTVRPMVATIDRTSVYYDANGNGKIDGYFDQEKGVFVPENGDFFAGNLEGKYEETAFQPVVDRDGNGNIIAVHQYFLRPYYFANPVSLVVPEGHDEDERMQVMPNLVTSITDPATYAKLTEEQKQYRAVISGATSILPTSTGTAVNYDYSADDHIKYGAEASAYSYVDMPLGGDVSPSRQLTSADLQGAPRDGEHTVSTTDDNGTPDDDRDDVTLTVKYMMSNGLAYYWSGSANKNIGNAAFMWEPDYRGNLLFPFVSPSLIYTEHSLAGDNIPVTKNTEPWYQKTDGQWTKDAPPAGNAGYKTDILGRAFSQQRPTEAGRDAVNGYLGAMVGNDTFALVLNEQDHTTAELRTQWQARLQSQTLGTLDETTSPQLDPPLDPDALQSVSKGTLGVFPDSEYLQQNSGKSGDANGSNEGQGEVEAFEFGAGMDPHSFSSEALAIFEVEKDDLEVTFSIGIPLYSKDNGQGTGSSTANTFDDIKETSSKIKNFYNAAKGGKKGKDLLGTLDEDAFGDSVKPGSTSVEFSLSLSVAISFKYNPLDNTYYFSEAAAIFGVGFEVRFQYRFTPWVPILYVYAQFNAEVTIQTGLGLEREAVFDTDDPILMNNPQKLYETGDGTERPRQYFFTTTKKTFSVKFEGDLYMECYRYADLNNSGAYEPAPNPGPNNDLLCRPPVGFTPGYISSKGEAVEVTLLPMEGLDMGFPVLVVFTVMDDGDPKVEATATIHEILTIKDIEQDIYWCGFGISIEVAAEVGVGIGIEIAKAEIFVTAGFSFAFSLGTYDADEDEYGPARVDSFGLSAGIGFRIVFLFFSYEQNLIEYHLNYDADEDKDGQDVVSSSGWSHGWSALGGAYGEDSEVSSLGGDSQKIDVYITPPTRTNVKLFTNNVNGEEGDFDPLAYNTNTDFQVSGYGASVNAFKLAENGQVGYDYRIVTVGDYNYIVYTGSRTGTNVAGVDATQLMLSKLVETGNTYGLVNPIAGNGGAGDNFIPVDNDDTGDLDFTAWEEGGKIHVTWVSYSTPTAVSAGGETNEEVQAQMMAASRNTEVRHAVFDPKVTDTAIGFKAADNTGDYTALTTTGGAYYFLPVSAGRMSVFASSVPYSSESALQARLQEYSEYLDDTTTSAGIDNTQYTRDYMAASKQYRLAYQEAMLSIYGGNSRLTVTGQNGTAYEPMYVSKHQEDGAGNALYQTNEILTNIEMAEIDGTYYLAYATLQENFEKNAEGTEYTDCYGITRLYLRSFTVEGNTLDWGEPYLLRTVVNYEKDTIEASGVTAGAIYKGRDGVYRNTTLQTPYKDAYISNIRFLNGRLGNKLTGKSEEFETFSIEAEDFLLFEMNGNTYVINEASLRSITAGNHTGTVSPFFTYKNVYGENATGNLSSGKSEVVIGADGDGNVAAVYTGSVPNTGNNAIFISYWDPDLGSWSAGVMLAMKHMQVYENSIAHGWDNETTKEAYLDTARGGGKDQLVFSNLQITLGSGTGANSLSTMDAGVYSGEYYKNLYGDLLGAEASGMDSLDTMSLSDRFALLEKLELLGADIGTLSDPTPELLILTQGSMTDLEEYHVLKDGVNSGNSVLAAKKSSNGTAQRSSVGVYAISYGKGAQQVGNVNVRFAYNEFTVGSRLHAYVNFRNVGDAAIRASGANPATVKLMLHTQGGASDTEMASWTVTESVGAGQTVSLSTTEQPCTTLTENLSQGDYFYIIVSEDAAYAPSSGGTAYSYRSYNDSNCAYRYNILDKPDLAVEWLTTAVSAVRQNGDAALDIDFDVTNRGGAKAEEVYVQLSYVTGYETEQETGNPVADHTPIYAPLDLTNSDLHVSGQRYITRAMETLGADDPTNGIIYLGTDQTFYTRDYYITEDAYNDILEGYYSTSEVSGWDQGVYNSTTYWYNPLYYISAYAAYTAGQAAVSGWSRDSGSGNYYNNAYGSYSDAMAAADAERKKDYILTAAQYEELTEEFREGWHLVDGQYIPIGYATVTEAQAAYELANADTTQDIKGSYMRSITGTIDVAPDKFNGRLTDSLDIRVEVFSASSAAIVATNGLHSSDHADEYYADNNAATAQIEHRTFITAPHQVNLVNGIAHRLPVSIATTTGTAPRVELVESSAAGSTNDPGVRLTSVLNYVADADGDGVAGTQTGALYVTPVTTGGGILHVCDTATNTTYPIVFTVSDTGDGINIFNDDAQFTFFNADGSRYDADKPDQDWAFEDTDIWTKSALRPYLNNVAIGQPGAYFTFETKAKLLEVSMIGRYEMSSNTFSGNYPGYQDRAAEYSSAPRAETADFGNEQGLTHTVKVKVIGEETIFDTVKPTYGGGYVPPSDDAVSPGIYFSRSFPRLNTITSGAIDFTVYAIDESELAQLSFNGSPIAADDPKLKKHDKGMWSYDFTVSDNSDFTVTARDTAGNTTTRPVTVNWFTGGTPTNPEHGTCPDLDASVWKTKNDGSTLEKDIFGPDAPVIITSAETLGGVRAVYKCTTVQGINYSYHQYEVTTDAAIFKDSGAEPTIMRNGYYMVLAEDTTQQTWSRQIFHVDCFEDVPIVKTTTSAGVTTTQPSVNVRWSAEKDVRSNAAINSVKINGLELRPDLATLGANIASGNVDLFYGGVYSVTATDSKGLVGLATCDITVPVTVPADAISWTDAWGQPDGGNATMGAISVDLSKIVGGDYDPAITVGALSDYSGSYEYLILSEDEYANKDLPDTTASPAALDWLDGETWLAASDDYPVTARADGSTTYAAIVRDAQNPRDYETMAVVYLSVSDNAIDLLSGTGSLASSATATDGAIYATAGKGETGLYEFAWLTMNSTTSPSAADFMVNTIEWRPAASKAGNVEIGGLSAGDYRLAVRAFYSGSGNEDALMTQLFNLRKTADDAAARRDELVTERTGAVNGMVQELNTLHVAWVTTAAAAQANYDTLKADPTVSQSAIDAAFDAWQDLKKPGSVPGQAYRNKLLTLTYAAITLADREAGADEIIRLRADWMDATDAAAKTAAVALYDAAVLRVCTDHYNELYAPLISAAESAATTAETDYKTEADRLEGLSTAYYEAHSEKWLGMLLSDKISINMGKGTWMKAVPTNVSISGNPGSITVTAGGGTPYDGGATVHYQFAIRPLASAADAVDYSGRMADIGNLNLEWHFADDLKNAPAVKTFGDLTAGAYQLFVRQVLDPNITDSYDVNNDLLDSQGGTDDLYTLKAAWEKAAEADRPAAEAIYLSKRNDILSAVDSAYAFKPGFYDTASVATVTVGKNRRSGPSTGETGGSVSTITVQPPPSDSAVENILEANRRGQVNLIIGDTRIVIPTGALSDADEVQDLIRNLPTGEGNVVVRTTPTGQKSIIISIVEDGRVSYLYLGKGSYGLTENTAAFSDVDGHWAEDDIIFTAILDLLRGMGDNEFVPSDLMTRAMAVTVLYRILGEPEVAGESPFTDVAKGSWYEKAVLWAYQNDVVKGVSPDSFAPNASITREQMITLLYRFLVAAGLAVDGAADLSGFPDVGNVRPYALDAFRWAVAAGIIEGTDKGELDPQGNATRAQMATMFARVVRYILN